MLVETKKLVTVSHDGTNPTHEGFALISWSLPKDPACKFWESKLTDKAHVIVSGISD